MEPKTRVVSSRAEIVDYYKRATYCYATPFALLVLGYVVPFVARLGALLLLPLAAAGLFFTWRGFQLARQNGDTEKKDVGYANLILGVIILGLGLVGLGLAYVMVS